MKKLLAALVVSSATLSHAELAEDWLSLASVTNGGVIHVDAGGTNLAKSWICKYHRHEYEQRSWLYEERE